MNPLRDVTNTAAAVAQFPQFPPQLKRKREVDLLDEEVDLLDEDEKPAKRARTEAREGTDTHVTETVAPMWQLGAGLKQTELDWLSGDSSTPMPEQPISTEGEWKEEAEFTPPKVHQLALTYTAVHAALLAHSVLTDTTPKHKVEITEQLKKMAESKKGLTKELQKSLSLPGEGESKQKKAQDNDHLEKLEYRCANLASLEPYLVDELGKQKGLPVSTIQKAIQMGLKLIASEGNMDWDHFKTLKVDKQSFLFGCKDNTPTLLFFQKILGQGNYGHVHKVIHISGDTSADTTKALKHSYTRKDGESSFESLKGEIETIKLVGEHDLEGTCIGIDFSLQLLTHNKKEMQMGYLTPLCEGDLAQLLQSKPSINTRLQYAQNFITCVLKTIDSGIIPTDIKPHNMLIKDGAFLFGDLMDAYFLEDNTNFDIDWSGTYQYICPMTQERVERVVAEKDRSKRSEVLLHRMLYSCASVLYEILVGRLGLPRPVKKVDAREGKHPDLSCPIDTKPLAVHAPQITKLMERLLHQDPDKRLHDWTVVDKVIGKLVISN
ncbi:MAG: hypothetical protein H0X51_06355 [Parachlamydiaceae bacterium]|nr:hypothetical protein [Parachlamydiaceae bacterium]